ncbi:apolipoprotein N-acyltransferase [Nocardia sp. 348MFTsu5.1]|uniref:apolipoprotein N-acyltransferase n=1 Tax=Nocardia sp. 348MFTsu5.1 TaxID=1172185 RepID=UPI000378A1C9
MVDSRASAISARIGSFVRTPMVVRTVAAAIGGVLMWAAFPPRNLWFLGIASFAVLALSLKDVPRFRDGFLYGFAYGLGFFLPLLPWIGVYVGPLPWVALAVVMSLYTGLFGVLAVRLIRLPAWPLWFALAWVTVEWARSSFPFGGFPWGRAAFGQVGGPMLSLASLGGAPLVSFALALTGAGLAAVVTWAVAAPRQWTRLIPALIMTLVTPIVAALLWPSVDSRNDSDDQITIAAIQGNVPRLGLDFNSQRRAVLDNHVRETIALAAAVRAGEQPRPDLVIWPENASDIDPTVNEDAAEQITMASVAIDAPILVGTLVQNPDGRPTNTVLVWDGRQASDGLQIQGRYDKQIIQPFGEYLPWRSFFTHFSSYAASAGNFKPGSGPGVVEVETYTGKSVTVGISTCWEIAFDRSARKAVQSGAEFLAVPTNNATFGRTQMTYQQLAMSQLRAVEHGRAVVVAATTGVSAIVAPDGHTTARSGFFEPAMMVESIPLHTDQTIATKVGPWPERLAVLLTVCGFLFLVVPGIRLRGWSKEEHGDGA